MKKRAERGCRSFLAALLPLFLLLAGCEAKPYDVYMSALDKTAALASVSCSFSLTYRLDAGGREDETAYVGEYHRDPDTVKLLTNAGGAERLSILTGGDAYFETDGTTGRMRLTGNERAALAESLAEDAEPLRLGEDDFAACGVETVEGETQFYGTVPAERAAELLGPYLEARLGLDVSAFAFTDLALRVGVTRDGYVGWQTLAYALAAELDGTPGTVSVEGTIVCHRPGTEFAVELPEDMEEWPQVTGSD